MSFTSTHRGARISPTKVRPVLAQIRGKSVEEAVTILDMSKRRGAVMIKSVLLAALGNADFKEANTRGMIVSEARADKGPTMKRWQPKDRGRAHPIKKRTSHILISVDNK